MSGVETALSSAAIEGVGGEALAPPPPPPAPPMRLHSGMTPPVKIADATPVYPVLARNAHVQGVVILETVLDAQGRVDSVHVLRSFPLLDQAAVDAVRQWRFTPALLNGQPVPVVHDGDRELHAAVRTRVSVARSMLPPLITQTTFLPAS